MSQITVDIDDELIASLGRDEVDKELAEAVRRLELRRMAREAIEDLKEIDKLIDSPEWQAMRQQTWEEHGHRYMPRRLVHE
ncbi:MAG: hypothetical protein H7Z72_21295 [Bacteroidetes bacterium]|nr:hypothetical protein [Fibrella sp.]